MVASNDSVTEDLQILVGTKLPEDVHFSFFYNSKSFENYIAKENMI